jgi:hypothetical protein
MVRRLILADLVDELLAPNRFFFGFRLVFSALSRFHEDRGRCAWYGRPAMLG